MLVAVTLLLGVGNNSGALAQEGGSVSIANPTDGETVSGLLIMTGSMDFTDFLRYEVYLKSGDQMIWTATVFTPVVEADLARLDTRTVLDGTYQLIIRQVKTDSGYDEYPGPTIHIKNNLSAPQPYPEIEASPLYAVSGKAVARIKNCSNQQLKFDYHSPAGFCSGGDFTVAAKVPNSTICTYTDVLLIPCTYRGTASGQGNGDGATYDLIVLPGKVYEFNYPGANQLFYGDVEAEEMVSTLSSNIATTASIETNEVPDSEPVVIQIEPPVVTEPETMPAGPVAAVPVATPVPAVSESVLPEAGGEREANMSVVIMAGGLLFFLVVGGVMAVRRRNYVA